VTGERPIDDERICGYCGAAVRADSPSPEGAVPPGIDPATDMRYRPGDDPMDSPSPAVAHHDAGKMELGSAKTTTYGKPSPEGANPYEQREQSAVGSPHAEPYKVPSPEGAGPDHDTPLFDERGLPNSKRFSRLSPEGAEPRTEATIAWPKSWTPDDIAWAQRQIIGEWRRAIGLMRAALPEPSLDVLATALHEIGGEFCDPFTDDHPVGMHNSQAAAIMREAEDSEDIAGDLWHQKEGWHSLPSPEAEKGMDR